MFWLDCSSFAQTKTYKIDAERSTIAFEIAHLGVLSVKGKFDDFSGKVTTNNDTLYSLESTIDVTSINTGDASRDKTLIGDAFLNASQFPLIRFYSMRVENASKGQVIFGKLKIQNVLKDIIIPYKMTEEAMCSFKITTILSRKEFNLDFGPMNTLIGDDIKVIIDIIGKPLK